MNISNSETIYALECVGDVDACALDARHELFWIIREALNNVRSHAHATRCVVRVRRTSQTITATVADNGRGMAPAPPTSGSPFRRHLGLPAMRARAERLGGSLQLRSSPGGTQVCVTLPLRRAARAVV